MGLSSCISKARDAIKKAAKKQRNVALREGKQDTSAEYAETQEKALSALISKLGDIDSLDGDNQAAADAIRSVIEDLKLDRESVVIQIEKAGLQAPAMPVLKTTPKISRWDIGRALSSEEKKSVIKTLVDVYREKNAPRELKGIGPDGNERYGYVHSPELFEKSDITGSMVRYYVTLPNGQIAHPSELFPDFTQAQIDDELIRQAGEDRRKESNKKWLNEVIDSVSNESLSDLRAYIADRDRRNGKAINDSLVEFYSEKEGKWFAVEDAEVANNYADVLAERGYRRVETYQNVSPSGKPRWMPKSYAGEAAEAAVENKPDQWLSEEDELNAWFGNSMVVGSDGRPLTVYHTTYKVMDQAISEFDRNHLTAVNPETGRRIKSPSIDSIGTWFSNNPAKTDAYGEGAQYPAHLKITKPKVFQTFDQLRSAWDSFHGGAASKEGRALHDKNAFLGDADGFVASLKGQGFDGIIILPHARQASGSDMGSTEFSDQAAYVVFDGSQVRSVFDRRAAGEVDGKPDTVAESNTEAAAVDAGNQPKSDMTVIRGDMFTQFLPNTAEGKRAWDQMAVDTDGTGKVLNQHAESVIEQLKSAGYSVEYGGGEVIDADALLAELAGDQVEQNNGASQQRAEGDGYASSAESRISERQAREQMEWRNLGQRDGTKTHGLFFYETADDMAAKRGSMSGYDRIIMNPPFSNRRDAEHVQHAYTLLRPGGRIVAIMGEGVFFGQDAKAVEFREWLESVGGTSEKLPDGSFLDPSLPVTTGVNARMVVIEKPAGESAIFNREEGVGPLPESQWLPTGQLVDHVAELLSQFKTEIPVTVIDNEGDILPGSAVGNDDGATSGFNYRGRIYMVRSGLIDTEAATDTLFHELLHFGIRRFVPEDQYIAHMERLYQADPWIQARAEAWLNTPEGLEFARKTKNDRLEAARGVDEALAQLAEILHQERITPNAKPRKFFDRVVQNVMNWLRGIAESFGWNSVKQKLDDLEPGKISRDYVESIFKRLRDGENPPFMMTSKLAYSDPAFNKPYNGNSESTGEVNGSNEQDNQDDSGRTGQRARFWQRLSQGDRFIGDEFISSLVSGRGGRWSGEYVSNGFGRNTKAVRWPAQKIAGFEGGYITLGVFDRSGIFNVPVIPEVLLDGKSLAPEKLHDLSISTFSIRENENGNFEFCVSEPNKNTAAFKALELNGTISATGQFTKDGQHEYHRVDLGHQQTVKLIQETIRRYAIIQGDIGRVQFTRDTGSRGGRDDVYTYSSQEIKSKYAKNAKRTEQTPQQTREALTSRFGERGISALEKAGMLRIMRLEDAPDAIRQEAIEQGASALYTADGTAYLFSDRMTAEEAPGKLLHELGEHHGLEKMLGSDGWSAIRRRVSTMAKARGSLASGAWNGVKANYSEFTGMSDDVLAGNDRFIHEVLAAIGENQSGQKTSLWREILAKVKAWLASMGFAEDWINEGDIANLVSGSLKRVMRDAEGMPVREIESAYNDVRKGAIDFWKEFEDAIANARGTKDADKSVSERLVRAFSQTQRGGIRYGRLSDNEGVHGEEVIDYIGEPFAGFTGYKTTLKSVKYGKDYGFTMYVVPSDIGDVTGDSSNKQLADVAAMQFQFIHLGDDKYELGVSEALPGTKAMEALQSIGRVEGTGNFDSTGREYYRLKLDDRYQTMHKLMSEAVRRLAVVHGGVPEVYFPRRDTGARAGLNKSRSYTQDQIKSFFSKSSSVDRQTIEGIVTDYFTDIVAAMKSANQLVEEC